MWLIYLVRILALALVVVWLSYQIKKDVIPFIKKRIEKRKEKKQAQESTAHDDAEKK